MHKKNRIIFYKKGNLMGEETLRIILSVICIVGLIALGVKLYLTWRESDLKKADATLNEILSKANTLNDFKTKTDIIVLNPRNWHLISFEYGSVFCDSDFCLCMCEDKDCSNQKICKPTEKFFLLRDKTEKEVRILIADFPYKADLIYNQESYYPFNKDIFYDDGWLFDKEITPIFLKYDAQNNTFFNWFWSPDLIHWMSLENFTVKGGKWDGKTPSENNKKFILEFRDYLSRFDKEIVDYKNKGIEFLNKENVKESKGIFIFQLN